MQCHMKQHLFVMMAAAASCWISSQSALTATETFDGVYLFQRILISGCQIQRFVKILSRHK